MTAKESPEESLKQFKRNKRNRSVKDWLGLLLSLGWKVRIASKEGYVLKCGSVSLTLPDPHGSDKVIKVGMAGTILRQIDAANLEQEIEKARQKQEDPNDE